MRGAGGCADMWFTRVGWALLLLNPAILTAAPPEWKAVVPACCQRGASIEVECQGKGLGADCKLHFSAPGFTSEHLDGSRFRVTATTEVSPGNYDVWISTSANLLGPRRFTVTNHAVVLEGEANDQRGAAQQVSLPSVIEGRFEKPADLDWYALDADAGQQITITCRSKSLDGSSLPLLTLVAPDGRELAHSRAHRFEPRLVQQLPMTGRYRVLVHDRSYRRDDHSFYHLEIGTQDPSPPTAAKPASDCQAGPLPIDRFEPLASLPEPSNSRQTPHTLTLPCRIEGRLEARHEVDWYRFHAEKGAHLRMEAVGERLGQMMDLDLFLHDADGQQIAAAKDIAAPKGAPSPADFGPLVLTSLDPLLEWKAPATGDYTLGLRDLYGGSVFGPDRRYELVVEPVAPRFWAAAIPAGGQPGQGPFLKRGSATEVSIAILRTAGFQGPVTIRLLDPPPGVSLDDTVVDAKQTTHSLQISAAADAPIGLVKLRLAAEAEISGQPRQLPLVILAHVRAGLTRRLDGLWTFINE